MSKHLRDVLKHLRGEKKKRLGGNMDLIINSMCQPDLATVPDICSKIILSVSVKVFLDEANI